MHKLLLLFLSCLSMSVYAENWTRDMADGTIVRIDPTSRTATHFSSGGTTRLWDGVHETSDGTVIIVKDGVVVTGGEASEPTLPPTATDQASKGTKATPVVASGEPDSTCVNLVIKTCGFDGECASSPGCSPARQLLSLQTEETMGVAGATIAEVTDHCREAMADERSFPACTEKAAPAQASSCQKLSEKVCGSQNQCSDSPACAPSRQLVEMEGHERQAQIRRPERQIKLSRQCEKLLEGDTFFTPCNN